jgi:SsrA-binding protein
MKQDVDSILLANWYFTKCKIEGNSCAKKTELARKYLVTKIQKALLKGMTIIPLKVHIINNFFKVDIALAQGKKNYDKRESIKERDIKRDLERI